MSRTSKILYLLAGLTFDGVGLLIGVIGLLAVIDPAGTKMADDSDPFGSTTGSVPMGIVLIIISIAIISTGMYLIWRIDNKNEFLDR